MTIRIVSLEKYQYDPTHQLDDPYALISVLSQDEDGGKHIKNVSRKALQRLVKDWKLKSFDQLIGHVIRSGKMPSLKDIEGHLPYPDNELMYPIPFTNHLNFPGVFRIEEITSINGGYEIRISGNPRSSVNLTSDAIDILVKYFGVSTRKELVKKWFVSDQGADYGPAGIDLIAKTLNMLGKFVLPED